MATHVVYEMYAEIRYKGRLIDVLDRIRAVGLVLMVHIEKDLGPDRELIKLKVMTPHAPKNTFTAVRNACVGQIEELVEMTLQTTTLTKVSN
jgi:hypothetical protein